MLKPCPNCGTMEEMGKTHCSHCHTLLPLTHDAIEEDILELDESQLEDERIRLDLQKRFSIIREIGRGGMAVVYEAIEPELDRKVAIKALPPGLARDFNLVRRFKREAKISAGLVHPHIIPVHSVGVVEQSHYFTMAYMEGGNLLDRLQKGPLEISIAIQIVRQVASALDYAQKKGVIHRDIKPANIMFDDHGTAVLGDFGIAKALLRPQLTTTRAFFGTPHYISPEQAMGRMIDGRSDLYSLGVLFYQMVSGRLPFSAEDPLSVLFQQVNLEPPSLTAVNPQISPEVEQIIFRLLKKDPTQRISNGERLIYHLDRIGAPVRASDRASSDPSIGGQNPSSLNFTRWTSKVLYWLRNHLGFGPWKWAKEVSVDPTQTIMRQPTPNRRKVKGKPEASIGSSGFWKWGLVGVLLCFLTWGGWEFWGSWEKESLDAAALTLPSHEPHSYKPNQIEKKQDIEQKDENPLEGVEPEQADQVVDIPIDQLPEYVELSKSAESRQDQQPVDEEKMLNLLGGLVFKTIPAGKFRMGSWVFFKSDEQPVHSVSLPEFDISQTEVTQELWRAVMGSNPSCQKGKTFPVENVTWLDVQEFLLALNSLDEYQYRLPTEAEWEYACRASTVGMFSGKAMGFHLGNLGWEADNSQEEKHPVGTKDPNSWGLCDMHGNVWEWCQDWYNEDYYERSPKTNPTGPEKGTTKVIRGGAFNARSRDCRSANRYYRKPDSGSCAIGFRLVRMKAGSEKKVPTL